MHKQVATVGDFVGPVGEGVAGYQAAISKTYGPMRMESSKLGSNKWEVNRSHHGPVVFSRITYDGMLHAAVTKDSASAMDRNIVLMCVERGPVEQKVGNQYSKCDGGSLVLLNMGKKLEVWQSSPTDVLSVTLPTSLLLRQCADIEKYCGVAVPTNTGAAAILRDMLSGVLRETDHLTGCESQSLSTAFGGMISTVFHNNATCGKEHTILDSYQKQISNIIDSEIQNTQLSPKLLADRLGVSRSYLFSVSSKAGFSIAKLILERRLNCCRDALVDSSWRKRSITEIAFTFGFKELSHFSRCFTKKFGISPKAYREQTMLSM